MWNGRGVEIRYIEVSGIIITGVTNEALEICMYLYIFFF